jgi:tetratricopeptide (TPR) repeat protein
VPQSPAGPTLGLGLIARDEADTLPRLLASCAGAFDEIVLVDTGSTDATVDCFQAWAATQDGTVCRVLHFTWIDDFAAARQVALEALTSDWACWADCDDILQGAEALRGAVATAGPRTAGLMGRYDYSPSEHGQNVRLVRRGHGRWHGVIHEALAVDGSVATIPGDVCRWVHLPPPATGDEPKPRMRRDLALLRQQVDADPSDARAAFYLAQTHRDLGETEAAVHWYEHRADMPGWDQETFYARYQAGRLLADHDWPAAMASLVEAWELRPHRLEPLQVLSAGLRVRGAYATAHLFAARGVDRPRTADSLFVADWVYDWGMLFEFSITAYWTGDLRGSRAMCERLLERDDLPALHRSQTEHNRQACIDATARRAVDGLATRS